MPQDLSKKAKFLKIALILGLLIILLVGAFKFIAIFLLISREPSAYDHLPQILSDKVWYERIDEREYLRANYKNGLNCDPKQIDMIINNLNLLTDVNNQYNRCHKFVLENGTIYWLQLGSFIQYLVLEKPKNSYELIIAEARMDYPGSAYDLSVRGDSKAIVFIYIGYMNPEKFFRLSPRP